MKIVDLLPFDLEPEQLIVAFAALSVFGAVLLVWSALLSNDGIDARARRLRQRRSELRAAWTAPRRRSRREQSVTLMRSLADRLSLLRNRTSARLAEQLAQAGWRSRDAAATFMLMRLGLPFVFGGVALLFFDVLGVGGPNGPVRSLAPMIAVGLGALAPKIYLSNAIAKRQKLVQKGLPDALDLLVICGQAGLSLDASMSRVASEMQRSCPEIAEEFGITAVELGFLPDRRKALENLTGRCPLPAMRSFVNTLLQTEKYGTPLSQALHVLSDEYRKERMLKAEEKAARLPAMLTVPMIVLILPPLMIVLIGPAILRAVDAFQKM